MNTNLIFWDRTQGNITEIDARLNWDLNITYLISDVFRSDLEFSMMLRNITGDKMFIPEYIRSFNDLNSIPNYNYYQQVFFDLKVIL